MTADTYKTKWGTVPMQSCEAALMTLSGQCNHASSWDDVGFSKIDCDFGNDLASRIYNFGPLTEKQLRCVQKQKGIDGAKSNGLIFKYRRQLEKAGFNLEALLDQQPLKGARVANPEYELRTFCFETVKESDKAIQMRIAVSDGKEATVWMPKSQLKQVAKTGDVWMAQAPVWLLKEKGLATA